MLIESASALIVINITPLVINLIDDAQTHPDLLSYTLYTLMLIGGILLSPFINGFIRVYYRNTLNGRMDLNDLYYYFEGDRYNRTLLLNLSFLLRLFLPAVLFFTPVILFEIIAQRMGSAFYGGVLYCDFFIVLCVLSAICLTLYSLKYYTVFALAVEDESLENKELFRRSKSIMSDQSVNAARLVLSYTPWILLCLTILPLLYVVPYMTQGLCIGAKWMIRSADEE